MRILIVLTLLAATAMAEDVTLTWQPPTERVNGVAFDVTTELDRYDIICSTEDNEVTETVPGMSEVSEHTFDAIDAFGNSYGEYQCYIRAVDTFGLMSEAAGPVVVSWEPAAPKPPSLFERIWAFILGLLGWA